MTYNVLMGTLNPTHSLVVDVLYSSSSSCEVRLGGTRASWTGVGGGQH